MKIHRYRDYPVASWKNGQGVTREVVKHDAGDSDVGFLWRLSLAEVSQSGAFSAYDGYDRTITLLGGAGFNLNFDDGTVAVLDTRHEPYDFDGGAPLQCQLIGGMSQDLNLMAKRGHMAAEWLVSDLDPAETITLEIAPNVTQVLFCLQGGARVENTNDGDGSRPHTLNAWDCAVLNEGDVVEITTAPNTSPKLFHAILNLVPEQSS